MKKRVDLTYNITTAGTLLLIEEHVPRHSQRIEPPVCEERKFKDFASARSWVKDNEALEVVKERRIMICCPEPFRMTPDHSIDDWEQIDWVELNKGE